MRISGPEVLIPAAAGLILFGAAIAVILRRRGDQVPVAWLAVVLPGVYLGLCATVENLSWLYWPCGALLLASAAVQVWPAIRPGRNEEQRR